jgi:predicted transcriptional regulator
MRKSRGMALGALPDEVRSLLAAHIASVLELDVLLAIRTRTEPVAADALARELRLNETATGSALEKFASAGLLVSRDGGYLFVPRDPQKEAAAEALADVYSRRRVSVIRFIYSDPSGSVSAFADAFKLRRED